MSRTNGRSETESMDVEHKLPASEDTSGDQKPQPVKVAQDDSELEKLRAERDSLVDRLARLQAEFENARKRAAREQQEFREYALADALKSLLPVVDSFERALQTSASDK